MDIKENFDDWSSGEQRQMSVLVFYFRGLTRQELLRRCQDHNFLIALSELESRYREPTIELIKAYRG
ncbi:MAG: hypothetical protein E6R07_00510 [Nevskiaceae bacterium]|nr:MAG: hypothetical protein E6R07_00510 [Nevskiaceae bacterium]